jgi:hypothetical protein
MTAADRREPGAALRALLRVAAEQVVIVSTDALHFAGRFHSLQARQAAGEPASPYPTAQPLVTLLRDLLYQDAFTRPWGSQAPLAGAAIPGFAQQLSNANASREQWHEGWQVEQVVGEGRVLARRYGMRRMLWPGEFVLRDGSAMAMRPGSPISVFAPRESHTIQAGFYFAFGEAAADEQDETHLLRLYWNVSAPGAIALVGRITQRLNRFSVPFKFKCVNAAEHFGRVDAAVLYTHRRFHRLLRLQLDDFLAGLDGSHLGSATPPFALPLRPGVALAEDPPGGESFGMHRCRLVAEGLWNAFVEQRASVDDRIERIATHLLDSGLSLQSPHLNPGSRFDYSEGEHDAA